MYIGIKGQLLTWTCGLMVLCSAFQLGLSQAIISQAEPGSPVLAALFVVSLWLVVVGLVLMLVFGTAMDILTGNSVTKEMKEDVPTALGCLGALFLASLSALWPLVAATLLPTLKLSGDWYTCVGSMSVLTILSVVFGWLSFGAGQATYHWSRSHLLWRILFFSMAPAMPAAIVWTNWKVTFIPLTVQALFAIFFTIEIKKVPRPQVA